MKLINYLSIRLIICFFAILTVWSVIYFSFQMHEIYHDLDEGLENLRQEFVLKANQSSSFVENMAVHNPLNIKMKEISYVDAKDRKDVYSTEKVYFQTEEEEEEVRMLTTAFYSESNNKYYELKIFTSNVEVEDLGKNMLYLLGSLWLVLLLSLVIIGRLILKRSNRPFFQLLDNLKEFHLDSRELIDFPKTSIYEFEELNKSVKRLLEENITAYTEQKNFIENASHELQTPLAIVVNKLELMMEHENMSPTQLKEISQILIELSRMRRMNSNLLLLSKIQNKQYAGAEDIDLTDLVNNIVDYFADLIDYKELKVDILNESTPAIKMSSDLAHILITNLIKNSIAHNIRGGRIVIKITDKYFSISNDGYPIDKNIDIFKRYISNTDNKQSSGLGLSIVKSICDLYKFSITHVYDTWHTINIRF